MYLSHVSCYQAVLHLHGFQYTHFLTFRYLFLKVKYIYIKYKQKYLKHLWPLNYKYYISFVVSQKIIEHYNFKFAKVCYSFANHWNQIIYVVPSGHEELFFKSLPKGKWNQKFTFPSKFLLSRWAWQGEPKSCILSIYLKGFWCLKINWFFLLCFVVINLRFGILLTVCSTLENYSLYTS